MKRRKINFAVALALIVARAAFAGPAVEADLLAAYAASWSSSVGGEDNAQVIIANTVAGSNAIQDQSGTGARIRIAGCYQSNNDVINQTTTGGIVNWLANNDFHLSDVVAQGSALGADLVTYICQNSDSGSIGAVAQQPGMYSSYNPGAFWSAVFAHETAGHNYTGSHSDGLLNPKTIMLHNYCGGGAAPPYFYTSPNIWFNGVRLVGDGNNCSQGGLIHGGDNAWGLSSYAQTVADTRARVLVGPNLNNVVLRWCFTNAAGSAPASTTLPDLIASSNAVVRGIGATFTGKALRIPGGTTGNTAANSISAYIDLPNGIISSRTNITIEIWATPLSAPNWARLCDFGRPVQAGDGLGAAGEYTGTPGSAAPGATQASDDIMLTAAIGMDINAQRFESKLDASATVTLDSGIPTTAGVQHHYAITFTDGAGAFGSGGGRWQWYRDGDAVAYLDVNYHLSSIEDVNNWLGRSLWSGDNMANNDYAEVRISSVAMSRGEVLANFLLGPDYFPNANVTLNTSDALGSTSFNAAGQWSSGAAPSSGNKYETYDFRLRTPATASGYTFAGDALTISGGSLLWKGTSSSTITINNLTVNGGAVQNAGSGTFTLAGNLKVTNDVTCISVNGPTTLTAGLSGSSSITYLHNNAALSGNNSAFTGRTLVGCGVPGNLTIDSEARLGANPATFTADQLTLNRGWLYTTATMAIDDSNRGLQLGVSSGIFNVAAGTTLTIANPISSPPMPGGVTAGLLIKDNTGSLLLTSPSNTHVGAIVINGGSLTIGGAGRLGSGSYSGAIFDNSAFVFNSSAAQTLSGVISGTGTLTKQGSGTLTVSGANTLSGAVTISAGTLYATTGNAANNRAFSYVSGITINSGATLRSSANALFGWDGSQDKPITVNASGTLAADGGAVGDVGGGTVTLAGGTLASLAASPVWGSWRFDNAGDKLAVTENSIVSAVNVKFANGGAIDVAAGKTLSFTGTITDATSGGASSVVKSGGTGTLVLSGGNTYTGTTVVNAGTMLVNGSIGSGAVTVASGGNLGGNGTVNGAITVDSGGAIAPGTSIGKLTVNNSVTLLAGSTTFMEISKAALTNDQLQVSGALTYAGTLNLTNLAGTLVGGDTFKLFSAASYNGALASVTPASPGANVAWNTNMLTVDGTLRVVSTTATNLAFTWSGGALTLSWPPSHLGWRLETNGVSPAQTNSWFTWTGSVTTNRVWLTVDPAKTNVFFRLSLP